MQEDLYGDETGLLRAAQDGQDWALGCLLSPHGRALQLFCALMLGDALAADRAMEETVQAARSEVVVVESAASVRMWIHRIAARVCLQAIDGGATECGEEDGSR